MSEKVLAVIGATVLAVAAFAALVLLCAYPVKWIWNATVPDIFHLTTISFWQAVGLTTLSGLLFRSGSSK